MASNLKDFTYSTCQPCRNRHPGCHSTCPGYQYREAQKEAVYAERLSSLRGMPDRIETEKRIAQAARKRRMKKG